MMNEKELLNGVGYCGLVCLYCNGCDSCRDKEKGVPIDDIECFHRRCSIKNGLDGCWDCNEFPCEEGDMFNNKRVKAFVQFIKEEGLETFFECINENQKNGIRYGESNDYDKVSTGEEVIQLLNKGRKRILIIRL